MRFVIDTTNLPTPDHQSLIVGAVLVVAAILASVVVEVVRRKYSAKQLKKFGDDAVKLSKSTTALLLGGVSAVFTALGYLLVLADANSSYLSTLPFVGKHVLAVVGVGYTLYNIRLNKTFQHVADILNSWTKKSPSPLKPAVVSLPETEPNFETE